jgi:transposase
LTDKETISQQELQLALQSQKIKSLEEKVAFLLELPQKQNVKKDSHNSSLPPSSLPPSSDLFTKNKSLRPLSTRPNGGQPGHRGSTLEMRETPDKTIDLKSDFCSLCGQFLTGELFTLKSKRQVIEIPPIIPIYEEYRQYACQSPTCEHQQLADFPLGINAPIQYGSSVETLVGYFSVYQFMPFKRLQSLFSQLFSLPVSQASIGNMLERSAHIGDARAGQCAGIYGEIKAQILQSSVVVGSDETGAKVNGAKWWIWAWQNVQNTFLVASDNGGVKTVDEVFENSLPNSIIVSDRWAAELKTHSKNSQLCLAHLLRDLIYLVEIEQLDFAIQFQAFIISIFDKRKIMIESNKVYTQNAEETILLEQTLNQLLLISIDKGKYPKSAAFQVSILKNRNFILPCLYNLEIPPDNNGSQRAIRNIKVKQKVSGQFKSGQNDFGVIRSVIDTLLKRGVELLPSLNQINKLQPV